MSWAEVKTVNSNLNQPLDKLVRGFPVILSSVPYIKSAVNLSEVSVGDKVYSVTNVYTGSQSIAAGTITTIQQNGNLYANVPFIYGWIQKA